MNIPQYITQIDKEWFRRVSKRPVQGTCIRFDESVDCFSINLDIESLKKLLDTDLTHDDITDWNDAVVNSFISSEHYSEIINDLASLNDDVETIKSDIYDDSGNLSFVTTNNDQTITGRKKFSKTVFIEANDENQYFEIENTESLLRGYFGLGQIWLDRNSGIIPINFRNFNRVTKARIKYDYTDTLLHLETYNNNGSGYKPNGVVLSVSPTDDEQTDSKVIPTMGWVNDKFLRKPKNGSYDTLGQQFPGTSTANTSTWTSGGTNGLTMGVTTRVCYDKTTHALWGFYQEMRFDKYGRLYSVGAEVRYNIDTATLISWI